MRRTIDDTLVHNGLWRRRVDTTRVNKNNETDKMEEEKPFFRFHSHSPELCGCVQIINSPSATFLHESSFHVNCPTFL